MAHEEIGLVIPSVGPYVATSSVPQLDIVIDYRSVLDAGPKNLDPKKFVMSINYTCLEDK